MTRRIVKVLYVDDEAGLLVADCEGGSAVIGAVLNGERKIPSNLIPAMVEVRDSLPPASTHWLGRMVRCRTAGDDQVCICIQDSDGSFRWRQFKLFK